MGMSERREIACVQVAHARGRVVPASLGMHRASTTTTIDRHDPVLLVSSPARLGGGGSP